MSMSRALLCRLAAPIAAMNAIEVVFRVNGLVEGYIVGVGMPDAVRADTLHHAAI